MRKLRTMHLFAGAGGGILADMLLGHQPVCAVEINEYCQQVLSARQKDGCLPWFPIFADVSQFDGRPWCGLVDIIAGGFPCQDISVAGQGAGIDGERSGLWSEMARIIGEVRPRFAFVENSPALVTRGLGRVLGDLAALGYDCRWTVLGAGHFGDDHMRERIWIVANSERDEQSWKESCFGAIGRVGRKLKPVQKNRDWQSALRELRGVDDVMARSVDRTDAIRNGQVPYVAAAAWRILTDNLADLGPTKTRSPVSVEI